MLGNMLVCTKIMSTLTSYGMCIGALCPAIHCRTTFLQCLFSESTASALWRILPLISMESLWLFQLFESGVIGDDIKHARSTFFGAFSVAGKAIRWVENCKPSFQSRRASTPSPHLRDSNWGHLLFQLSHWHILCKTWRRSISSCMQHQQET